ncbi:accessory gland protein Acp29AB-like [Drosophila subpulchrella]|uniref:accessory gland protein Acp29AB-like n=1 Tax=Drosophila subpulchrella TaxID=1486046 RepID=UPI0018A160D5|nr:accessory gland protein Acp29AB-like [Drosophila subpulchrella]
MEQLGGICLTSIALMVKQTADEQQNLTSSKESEHKISIKASEDNNIAPAKTVPANFEKIGQRFFYIEKKTQLNWFAAGKACQNMNGTLATLESQKEMDAIYEKQALGKYWTDLNNLVNKREFTSWSSGLKAPFLNWRYDQPDNSNKNEHCVTMFGPLMYDDNCELEFYFVCQANFL